MTWIWITVAAGVLVVGALVPVLAGRARRADTDAAEISAAQRYELLGHYVENPVATTDATAESLLRQGRERWNSAGAILADAKSAADFHLAEQVAREGLAHVSAAHARIGLPGAP